MAADLDVPALTRGAEQFLAGQRWCARVLDVTPVFAIGGVLGVFRASLVPAQPAADPVVWLVVGDLPPAYLVLEVGDSWPEVLAGYVDEMREWVRAVRAGGDLSGMIPVNVAPTTAHADLLERRLDFIVQHLLAEPSIVSSDV